MCIIPTFTDRNITVNRLQGKKENPIKEVTMSATKLDSILEGRRSQPHMLIEVMLDLQDQEGYLPEDALRPFRRNWGCP